ncbi:MAG: ACT domain-containing protein [Candidatus Obscuribacterales bacterium]|nr:ACT domain-containing protein [Candidatus Obscuribacterales bacterium]
MGISVKKGMLWRGEIENEPGTFANALEPFAQNSTNLQIVVGYSSSKPGGKGTVEIYPVDDEKSKKAATLSGLSVANESSCLIVEGDDQPGIIHKIAQAIAQAKINLNFAMCQSVDKKFQAFLGFHSNDDANLAEQVIKKLDF